MRKLGVYEVEKISVLNFREWAAKEFELSALPRIQEKIVLDSLVAAKKSELNQLRNSEAISIHDFEDYLERYYQKLFKKRKFDNLRNRLLILLIIFLLALVCLLYWQPKERKNRVSLVFALPSDRCSRQNIRELFDFFSDERIPVRKATKLIVQNNKMNLWLRKVKNMKLVFRVEFFLISRMGFLDRLEVLTFAFRNLFLMFSGRKFVTALNTACRQMLLEIPVSMVAMKKDMLDWIATTNSSYVIQHSIFHYAQETNVETYMFWYSENSSPTIFGRHFDNFDYDYFRDIAVKEHFVWTPEFAKFLETFTSSKVTHVGSILFYPRPKLQERNKSKDIDLLLFDVTPFADAKITDFYNFRRCMRFLECIQSVQERLTYRSLKIAMKSKRVLSPVHDTRYVNALAELQSEPNGWNFIHPSVNLYSLISRSKLVIGIPFTSAVMIAKELGVPCCYFLASDEVALSASLNGIPVVQNLDVLEKWIIETGRET